MNSGYSFQIKWVTWNNPLKPTIENFIDIKMEQSFENNSILLINHSFI